MKALLCILIVVGFVGCSCPARAADKAPALPIEAALKLAQDYLKEKAISQTVTSLTLEEATLRGRKFWYARWSAPIFGGLKPELGLQIEMNGDLVKVVSGTAEAGPGRRPYGVRDMR